MGIARLSQSARSCGRRRAVARGDGKRGPRCGDRITIVGRSQRYFCAAAGGPRSLSAAWRAAASAVALGFGRQRLSSRQRSCRRRSCALTAIALLLLQPRADRPAARARRRWSRARAPSSAARACCRIVCLLLRLDSGLRLVSCSLYAFDDCTTLVDRPQRAVPREVDLALARVGRQQRAVATVDIRLLLRELLLALLFFRLRASLLGVGAGSVVLIGMPCLLSSTLPLFTSSGGILSV